MGQAGKRGAMGYGNSATVLLVEDEASVLQVVRLILTQEGCAVLTAESEEDALDAFRGDAGKIDLLIADVKLKQGSGPGVAKHLRMANPGVKVVYMSGYLREDLIEKGLILRDDIFLPKPFDMGSLRSVIRARDMDIGWRS